MAQTIITNSDLKSYQRSTGTNVSDTVKIYKTITERDQDTFRPAFAIVQNNGKGSAVYMFVKGNWVPVFEHHHLDPTLLWNDDTCVKKLCGGMQLPNRIIQQWGITPSFMLAPGLKQTIKVTFAFAFETTLYSVVPAVCGPPVFQVSYCQPTLAGMILNVFNTSAEKQTLKLSYQAIGE